MLKKLSYALLCFIIFFSFTLTVSANEFILKDQQQVILLGNSITQLGEKPEGYVSLMRKIVKTLYPEKTIYLLNAGISGHKSTDMNARLQRDVLQFKPDWVTISVGINDVWHGYLRQKPKLGHLRGVPLDDFTKNLTEIVERAQSDGIKVALFTTTVIMEKLDSDENKTLAQYNARIKKIARKHNCLLVDLNKVFQNELKPYQSNDMSPSGQLTYDGVHMNESGNWLMAKTILSAFGVPVSRIVQSKPLVHDLVKKEMERNTNNMNRYAECNFEVGAPRDNEKRVVFYGSSSVDGWNLARDFPTIPILNRGIGGETTREMIHRFREDVVNLKPTALLLFYGSCNDFWEHNRMSPNETKLNTIRIVNIARANNIKIALGAISPVNDYIQGKDWISSHPIAEVKDINNWMKTYCLSEDIPYIDFFTSVADSNNKLISEYTHDGMHCNKKGYAQWKPLVIDALKKLNAWQD